MYFLSWFFFTLFGLFVFMSYWIEAYSVKIVNYFHKSFILDAWQGSEYASAEYKVTASPCLLYVKI